MKSGEMVKMKKGLVTIIIPIYNVENYLDKCLGSVVNQTYQNLEIICVDDGSTDSCPQLCEEWAAKDKRIMVIHQKNTGYGIARNIGIEHANGEYVCFLDSDDYIALDLVEKAYKLAEKEQADMVIWGFIRVRDGNAVGERVPRTEKDSYKGKEVQEEFLPDLIGPDLHGKKNANLAMGSLSIMCSMQMIQKSGWRWVSERVIISEDTYSVLCLCAGVKKVSILREGLYYYAERKGSSTQRYQKDRYKMLKECIDLSIRTSDELNYNERVKERLLYGHISCVLYSMKWIMMSDLNHQEKVENLEKIIRDPHFQNILSCLDFKNASIHKRIMLYAVKRKWVFICFLLLKIRTMKS